MTRTNGTRRARIVRALGRGITLGLTLLPLALAPLGCGSDEPPKQEDTGPKRRVGPDEPWRKEKPKPGPAAELSLPAFQSKELKNGLTVIVSEQPSLPVVDVRLVVHAGSALEKPKEAGLATLAYDMLDEGADGLDGAALSDAFAQLGTSLRVGNDREGGGLATSVLDRNLDPAVALLARVALKPTFDKDAFTKVVERRLSALVSRKGDPGTQAMEAFAKLLYGDQHPYGTPQVGTEETLKKIKVADAKKFWTTHAGPKNSALILVGKITLDEAVALAESHFGSWKAKAKRPEAPKDAAPFAGTKLVVVKGAPGAPQTIMYFGRPLLPRGHEDELKVELFNQVIGGMFSSRLNMNLREDKGWTYGAWSFFDGRLGKGPWMAGASIKAEHTADAMKEFFAEFDRIAKEPPTDEELALAKANLVKSLPGRFETVREMGGAASELFLYSLPLDYYATLPGRIEAVTSADVAGVAQQATAREGLAGVLVGDAAAIVEPVKALELGDVIVIEPGASPPR